MSILFAILIFSLIVFAHELGHFVTAKLSGVQVTEFAMFMGPALVKWKRGETQYSIRCIPFGGYCAMEGEDSDTDNPRSFQKAARWKRLIILAAGCFMNFVFALLLMVVVYLPVKEAVVPVISSFESFATVDGENGLQVGDEIVAFDGEKIRVRSDFDMMLMLNPGDTHDITVKRNGKLVELQNFVMEQHPVTNEDGTQGYRYGIVFTSKQLNIGDRIDMGWRQFLNSGRQVRISLQMLFNGSAGVSDLSGPVAIVDMMSETAESSESTLDAVMNLLFFAGILSTNLGIMNLLPIPALDGGRIFALAVTTAIEKITKKKVNPKYEGYIHAVGLVLLMALMVFVIFKDIFMLFKG